MGSATDVKGDVADPGRLTTKADFRNIPLKHSLGQFFPLLFQRSQPAISHGVRLPHSGS